MNNFENKKIKVIIVDDSETMRRFIEQLVAHEEDIEIVASAANPYDARDLIKLHNPNVLILDIEMPRMDGITFLSNLIRLRPMPVVMNSSITNKGADETFKALEIGAVDYICKPQSAESVARYKIDLLDKIRAASRVDIRKKISYLKAPKVSTLKKKELSTLPVKKIILIGASTGGIEALSTVLSDLPTSSPPILIVQHIPSGFSEVFANRLNEISNLTVYEAQNGQKIFNGCAYVAPGGLHMTIIQRHSEYFIKIHDGPRVSGHKPSVDELFLSASKLQGPYLRAMLLTGMGNDGAAGLKKLYDHGAKTVIQNKESSVVWGMPSCAIKMEPNHTVLSLNEMAEFCISS